MIYSINATFKMINCILFSKHSSTRIEGQISYQTCLRFHYPTLAFKIKCSITNSNTTNTSFRLNILEFSSIIEIYVGTPYITTIHSVRSHTCNSFKMTMYFIASSIQLECCNRRMMTYLLDINGTSLNPALICFSQYWIEWLF